MKFSVAVSGFMVGTWVVGQINRKGKGRIMGVGYAEQRWY